MRLGKASQGWSHKFETRSRPLILCMSYRWAGARAFAANATGPIQDLRLLLLIVTCKSNFEVHGATFPSLVRNGSKMGDFNPSGAPQLEDTLLNRSSGLAHLCSDTLGMTTIEYTRLVSCQ